MSKRMEKAVEKPNTYRIDTTLGELIAAASEVAFEYSDNDKEAYCLARLALIEILRKSTLLANLHEAHDRPSPQKQYFH